MSPLTAKPPRRPTKLSSGSPPVLKRDSTALLRSRHSDRRKRPPPGVGTWKAIQIPPGLVKRAAIWNVSAPERANNEPREEDRMKRREFIGAGVAGAAGVMVSACSGKEQSAAPAAAPPPPKFRAIARFSGLFGVVTSPGFDRAEVLFVNGPKVGFPNHLAILKAHQDNVTGAAPAREDEYDPTIGIWEIKQSQVSFGVAGTLQKGPAAGVPCPTNPSAWRDPSWIPSLTTVLGAGKAQVHPDLVKPGDLSSTIVDTRIALAAGVLGASQPTDRQARKMKFEMVGATGVPVRPVSDVVELDMPDITSLTITITPYTGSPTVLTISAP